MRVLLAVFVLAGWAAGDSIDYASAGSLAQHNVTIVGSIAATDTWSVTDELVSIDNTSTGHNQVGQLGTVDITTGTLVKTSAGFSFTGGSVEIKNSSGAILANEMFSSGSITQSSGNTFLNANLRNGGTTEIESRGGVFSSNTVLSTTVPEVPGLILTGSGLVGLWWLGRNKLLNMKAN